MRCAGGEPGVALHQNLNGFLGGRRPGWWPDRLADFLYGLVLAAGCQRECDRGQCCQCDATGVAGIRVLWCAQWFFLSRVDSADPSRPLQRSPPRCLPVRSVELRPCQTRRAAGPACAHSAEATHLVFARPTKFNCPCSEIVVSSATKNCCHFRSARLSISRIPLWDRRGCWGACSEANS